MLLLCPIDAPEVIAWLDVGAAATPGIAEPKQTDDLPLTAQPKHGHRRVAFAVAGLARPADRSIGDCFGARKGRAWSAASEGVAGGARSAAAAPTPSFGMRVSGKTAREASLHIGLPLRRQATPAPAREQAESG